MEVYNFKTGDEVHIDLVYHFLGLIPNDSYTQPDLGGMGTHSGLDDNIITFTKNVTVKFDVIVTG